MCHQSSSNIVVFIIKSPHLAYLVDNRQHSQSAVLTIGTIGHRNNRLNVQSVKLYLRPLQPSCGLSGISDIPHGWFKSYHSDHSQMIVLVTPGQRGWNSTWHSSGIRASWHHYRDRLERLMGRLRRGVSPGSRSVIW